MKGYKTVAFNALMTVGMFITVWTGHDTTAEVEVVKDNVLNISTALTVVWGIGNVWLRAITDSPIFKS